MLISKNLTPENISKIERAIAQAEKSTSGEIVPMIVSGSSASGHTGVIAILLAGVCSLATNFILETYTSIPWWFSLTEIVAAVFIYMWAVRSPLALRILTSTKELGAQAERRAQLEFLQAGLNKTDGSTGILLFVSAAERHAVVLADKTIADKLPAETWKGVIEKLLSGFKSGNIEQGFCDAIALCGTILAEHFPIGPDDRDELPNKLILKD